MSDQATPAAIGPGTVLGKRYRIVELIDSGGMSDVYRCVSVKTGRTLALKMLKQSFQNNAEYVRRFQNEAEAASRLNHNCIVQLVDVGSDGDLRYLVMEYVPGRTLKRIIETNGPLDPVTAGNIILRVLSALQHAHEQGVIHRDIKPQNIMISTDGYVKLTDFGIAHMLNRSGITQSDSVFGTADYLSPEHAHGDETDARSDIYSTGVVLYEMLTGRVPFIGKNATAVSAMHITDTAVPIREIRPEVPEAFAHVAEVAMRKDPATRYQSAVDMATDLKNAIDGTPRASTAPVISPPPPPKTEPAQTGESSSSRPIRDDLLTEEEKRRRRITRWCTLLLTAAVLLSFFFGGRAIYDSVINTAEVPDVVGMELAAAERAAAQRGLKYRVVENSHPSIPAGKVMLQAPEAGQSLKKGDTVVLTLSSGPAAQLMPQVTGMTLSGAIEAAKALGLTLTVIERVPTSDAALDEVLSQAPQPGAECHAGDIIQVTVAGGMTEMPNVLSRDVTEALQVLTAAGLKVNPNVSIITTEEAALHGLVASQSLEAGSQLVLGTSVTLSVYRVPSMTHSVSVTLSLPETQAAIAVRATLTQGTGEVTVYRGDFAPDSARNPEITVQCAHPGQYMLKVYVDEVYKYVLDVTVE